MKILFPEIQSWVKRLPTILAEHLGAEDVSEVHRYGSMVATHLIYKGMLDNLPYFFKLPNPLYLAGFLPSHISRDEYYLTYWRWVHRSALHHRNILHFGGELVSRPKSVNSGTARENGQNCWIPGFGTLWDACADIFKTHEQLFDGLSDTSCPFFPVTIAQAVKEKPFLPRVESRFGLFKKVEDVYSFGLRLCQALEALEARHLRLLDLNVDHLFLAECGAPFFLGHSRMVITAWDLSRDCEYGGGLSDGNRALFEAGSAWHLCPVHGDWRDLLPKISNFLAEVGSYINDSVRDRSSAASYKEAANALRLPANADVNATGLVEFWKARFGTAQPNKIKRKPDLKIGHFIDVENCRWSVLGMVVHFPSLLENVERLIARDNNLPTSQGHRWAVTPNWTESRHEKWWKKALGEGGIEHIRPEGECLPGQEEDDLRLIEMLSGKSGDRDVVVLYSSEGRHYCDAVQKILGAFQSLKIWVVGFGELNSEWHILSDKYKSRLFLVDALDNDDLIPCVKGEF